MKAIIHWNDSKWGSVEHLFVTLYETRLMVEWLKSKQFRVIKLEQELKKQETYQENIKKLKEWTEEQQLKQILIEFGEKEEKLLNDFELMKLKAASYIESFEEKLNHIKFIQNELELYGGSFSSYISKVEELTNNISKMKNSMESLKKNSDEIKQE